MGNLESQEPVTIALTMIVGRGDADVLRRGMETLRPRELFEQIVVVLTSDDEDVRAVAQEYATDLVTHKWASERYPAGDFAGARNAALDRVTCSYWMWLDADDVMPDGTARAIEKLRRLASTQTYDVGCAQYVLAVDASSGVPIRTVLRERIMRTASGIRWRYPVHEQLTIDWSRHRRADLKGLVVTHQPLKPEIAGAARNISILEYEYHVAPLGRTRHTLFYYGRDLYTAGDQEAAIPLLLDVIRDFVSLSDADRTMAFEAAELLAHHYLYDEGDKGVCVKTAPIGERFARVAEALSTMHAEPLVYIGDALRVRGGSTRAERYYKAAMARKFGEGGVQALGYYEYIPAARLASISKERGDLEEALWYNKKVLTINPAEAGAISDRKDIICQLLRGIL